MEAILNFIKDWLSGKTLSASWIVTLTIALTSVGMIGYTAYQEYTTMQFDIEKLKAQAHKIVEEYDDGPVIEQINNMNGVIIRLEEKYSGLSRDLERTENTVNSNNNPLAL